MTTIVMKLRLATVGLILLGVVQNLAGRAESPNSGEIVISQAQPRGTVNGSTVGFWALTNLARRDRHGYLCSGFADINPDHDLILQDDFDQLTFQVNSGGNDTTLVVQGPTDEVIRCGEDSDRRNRDAQIIDSGWLAGRYRIWVGAHHQGQRYSYSLTVSP